MIGLDQTGWPNLGSKKQKAWQMWCLTTEKAVFHQIRDDKSAATFQALVGGYQGVIVCDALSSHSAAARDGPYRLAGCWAHVLRKFRNSVSDFPQASIPLSFINELYAIEQEASSIAHRLEPRQSKSRAVGNSPGLAGVDAPNSNHFLGQGGPLYAEYLATPGVFSV